MSSYSFSNKQDLSRKKKNVWAVQPSLLDLPTFEYVVSLDASMKHLQLANQKFDLSSIM